MRYVTDQKAAIVTGGGSGIGRATAINLADEGVKVVRIEPSYPKKV